MLQKLWKNRDATIPIAILVFWAVVLFCAWTLPLLTRPAQKKKKAKGTTERKQEAGMEGFATGAYPQAVDTLLLQGDYNEPPQPSLSPYSVAQMSHNYPVFPAGSCGTNNLRYWRRPGNGTCPWPELCGAMYSATPQRVRASPQPPAWNSGRRVNYYESCLYDRVGSSRHARP